MGAIRKALEPHRQQCTLQLCVTSSSKRSRRGLPRSELGGGGIPALGGNYVDEIEKKVPTLSKILPELRLLAVHKGKQYEKAFDKMVVPWAHHALGCVPHQLQYDADLSMLQILTWKTPITEKEETTTASEGSSGKRAPAGRREPPSSNAAAIQSNHAQVAGHQSGHVTDAIGVEK